jgi:hypothetical protein
MPAEFKISRLIYTWSGEWATTTVYKRDSVTQYEGKMYLCLEPHTSSANFYTDLEFPVFPRWQIMVDGKVWKTDWEPNTFYSLGNIVRYGGIVYVCTDAHTSGAEEIDSTKWDIFARYANWKNEWETNTVYGIDDIVKYGGITYRCIANHVSSSSVSSGLEADQGLDSSLEKWEIVNAGIEYKGEWSSTGVRYKKNDIVKAGGTLFKCKDGHSSSGTFDINYWDIWIPGLEFVNSWGSGTRYNTGETVIYGGYSYVSLSQNNIGNIPSTTSSVWELLSTGYDFQGEWSSSTSYKIGQVVRRSGYLYTAIKDNGSDPIDNSTFGAYDTYGSSGTTLKIKSHDSSIIDIVPGMIVSGNSFTRGQTVVKIIDSTSYLLNEGPDGTPIDGETLVFVGINWQNWGLISPGINWRGFWEENIYYVIGDLVYYQNVTYRCIRNNPSSVANNPKFDTLRSFWSIYALHDKFNALINLGDLVYFNGTENVPLPIPVEGLTVENPETKLLKAVNNFPSWEKAFITPNVFYVATTGVDDDDYPDRGMTWDHPWASIKYACEYVASGIQYQNTKTHVLLNKDFMIEEMWQWMEYQKANSISPYNPSSTYDETKTRRDAKFVVDAVLYDITRGGNSQTVATALSYFKYGSTSQFINTDVSNQMPFFIPALTYLKSLLNNVLTNTEPTVNYQLENDPLDSTVLLQVTDDGYQPNTIVTTTIDGFMDLIINSLTDQSTENLPEPNQGITVTIYVKSGTYQESLPIVVPANCAVVGDELRGTTIEPLVRINTLATSTNANGNVTVLSSEGLFNGCPIQFVSTGEVLDDFANITIGQTYYVINLVDNTFKISETLNGDAVTLANDIGDMYVIGGDALSDMFYMQNGTGLRNCTLNGLLGTLTEENEYFTRRPTGGSYVSLDPGTGPDDTSVWIYRRSPYIQNVTTFGYGCVGMKVDGTLHNGGNKSIVANDFTQILSDGIGVWITGPGSLSEVVSVFSYYNYAGYFAENGGRIRGTNGNSSYGTYGVIAEGFDDTETPITGNINNRTGQAIATVQSSFGIDSALLKIQYDNAGNNYVVSTTNMLQYSNQFDTGWTNDGNVTLTQSITPPVGFTKGWTLTGLTSSTDTSYIYQNVSITPAGGSYSGLSGSNITGSGIGAIFTVTVGATGYSITVTNGGSGYVSTNQILILGSEVGGRDSINDVTITVDDLIGSSIDTVFVSGTVPTGSDLNYTLSIYVGKGTSSAVDVYALFTGSSTKGSSLTYNFDTDTLTPASQTGSGLLPTLYGRDVIDDIWTRIWFSVYDVSGLNDNLQFRIYPRTKTGNSGSTYVYGSQLQINEGHPTFPIHTEINRLTAFANYEITGAGTGAILVGDELRSNSVFQTRITDGGDNYLTASNNAQGGNLHYIVLAQSDINESSNLERMRLIITSGTGAGQYGYIANYNPVNKYAYVLKESFSPLEIISTSASTNTLTLANNDTSSLYQDMPIQFIPTFYTTDVTSSSQDMQMVTQTVGGLVNQITVESTTRLYQWMPVSFSGTVYGGVITNFTYYISSIVDATHIQVSNELYGTSIFLNTASGSMTLLFPANNNYFICDSTADMEINMPIQFTGEAIGNISVGTTYYINDIVDATNFTISNDLVTVTATATAVTTNYVTVDDASVLSQLNPIIFRGTSFGGIVDKTKYYINRRINSTTVTISDTLISTTVTQTAATSNLITCGSTTGFVANTPIKFVGTTFGNLISGNTYYIQAINDGTSFTVSTTVGGGAVTLTSAIGECTAKTVNASLILSNDSGSMVGTSTTVVRSLSSETGLTPMEATFSTSIFGGLNSGSEYYIKTITTGSPSTIQVSSTSGGSVESLQTDTGSMQIGEMGWDHVNPGTPAEPVLDSTSLYFVEARPQFSEPPFTQTTIASGNVISLAPGTEYIKLAYGDHYWVAIPNQGNTAMGSSNGENWDSIILPTSGSTYTDIAYGNKYWVIVTNTSVPSESGSRVLYSNSRGEAWRVTYLPSKTSWAHIEYGNSKFVAIAQGVSTSAYSTDHGKTWLSGSGLPSATWSGLAYGKGIFVAVASGGTTAAYSNDGISWTSTTLPRSTTWTSVSYGKNMFVAVSSTSGTTAYTFDGITWYESNISISASKLMYGQGLFIALTSSNTTAYTSRDGIRWDIRTVSSLTYSGTTFGFKASTYKGAFITVGGQQTVTSISAGTKAIGRSSVEGGEITEFNMIETGSGYTSTPTLTLTDPNVTTNATPSIRVGDGVLSSPTFINRGTGYNTNTTAITINGDGFADEFQTGLTLYCYNISKLPAAGDNLVINGNPSIYKVTSAVILEGSVVPNLKIEMQIAPDMTVAKSPPHHASLTIRQLYSQVRLTNHDFLNIGYGNFVQSNYPGSPSETQLSPQNQTVENNYGRVFYTSSDQDGNFKVGSLFGVEQATGIVTLSASQFGLQGLETLKLGGVAVGGSSVIVTQFSTDPTFIANSNAIIPTQKAIRSYLSSRLSQGGSNTFTGQCTAGTVVIGGPNQLSSTIPEGIEGSGINMLNKVSIYGPTHGIDGDMSAFFRFTGTWFR